MSRPRELDETQITRLERARVKFRDKYPELYAWIVWLIVADKFPLAWQYRPVEELPRIAHLVIEEEARIYVAGLVHLDREHR